MLRHACNQPVCPFPFGLAKGQMAASQVADYSLQYELWHFLLSEAKARGAGSKKWEGRQPNW